MYDCTALTEALQAAGFRTHIETSAAYPLSGKWDWICVSPKKFKSPIPSILQQASELKVVVFNSSDLLWAEQNAQHTHADCQLYVQPEWSKEK